MQIVTYGQTETNAVDDDDGEQQREQQGEQHPVDVVVDFTPKQCVFTTTTKMTAQTANKQ